MDVGGVRGEVTSHVMTTDQRESMESHLGSTAIPVERSELRQSAGKLVCISSKTNHFP